MMQKSTVAGRGGRDGGPGRAAPASALCVCRVLVQTPFYQNFSFIRIFHYISSAISTVAGWRTG